MAYNIGLNVIEVDGAGAPALVGAATSVAGFNITTQRGIANRPSAVTSYKQFSDQFGAMMNASYGAYMVKGFFDNGGQMAYINRVVSSDATAGTCWPPTRSTTALPQQLSRRWRASLARLIRRLGKPCLREDRRLQRAGRPNSRGNPCHYHGHSAGGNDGYVGSAHDQCQSRQRSDCHRHYVRKHGFRRSHKGEANGDSGCDQQAHLQTSGVDHTRFQASAAINRADSADREHVHEAGDHSGGGAARPHRGTRLRHTRAHYGNRHDTAKQR